MANLVIKFVVIVVSVHSVMGRSVNLNHTLNRAEELIKEIPICNYSDPNVSECIQRAAETARVFLAHGIPSMGIQPLEPLKVPSVRLRQHNAQNKGFKYDAWLSDVTLSGLTDYSFNRLDVYPEEMKVSGNISLPHLHMTGEFVVLGHFQMLPVESTGKLSANFTMCSAAIEAVAARVHKRMVVRDAFVRLRCGDPLHADLNEAHSATGEMANNPASRVHKLTVEMDANAYSRSSDSLHAALIEAYCANGDIEMITDHILKTHSSEIIGEVQPVVETTLAMVLEDVANKFLKHVPYDMVFPR